MNVISKISQFFLVAFGVVALAACGSSSGGGDGFDEDDLVGTWVVKGENENEILFFVFFDDGTYIHAEYDAEKAGGEEDGMEWGEWSVDEDGIVDVEILFDNNGDTGLTDFEGTDDLKVSIKDKDTLKLEIVGGPDEGDSLSFSRLESTGEQGSFWNTETENDLLAFTFLGDGTYCHFEVEFDNEEEDSGMECAEYEIGEDNVYSWIGYYVDNNDDTGLTDFNEEENTDLEITFDADSMTLDIVSGPEAETSYTFDRI